MTDALLTDDGCSAASIQTIARLCGSHRDQIRLWRREGTPADLELAAWYAWLDSSRRWTFAAALAKILPDLPGGQPAGDQAPAAPLKPASDESKESADLRYSRLRADKMQRELAELDGRLIPRVTVAQVTARLAAVTVDRLNRGIWNRLLLGLRFVEGN